MTTQTQRKDSRTSARRLLPVLAALAACIPAHANTLNQNVSWTVDRSATSVKYRIVAYGDSIYAGYNGSTTSAARYSAAASLLFPAREKTQPALK